MTAIRATLLVIADAAPGSSVVFDYRLAASLLSPLDRAIGEVVAQQMAVGGEHFISEFEPLTLAAELESLGFHVVADPSAVELRERYLARRKDGLSVGGAFRVMTARVQRP